MTCLSHLQNSWPRDGVLRVELFLDTPPKNYNLKQSYAKEFQSNSFYNRDRNKEYSSLSTDSLHVTRIYF